MDSGLGAFALGSRSTGSLEAHPDRVLVEGARSGVTAGELLRAVHRLERHLCEIGIGAGDGVLLALPNGPALVAAVIALWRQSARVVLLSEKAGVEEIGPVLDDARPQGCIASPGFIRRAFPVLGGVTIDEETLTGERVVLVRRAPAEPDEAFRRAVLVKYTSGSLGRPKGVLLSAENVLAEANTVLRGLDLAREDAVLVPVPLTHSYGFDLGVLPAVLGGVRLVLHHSFVPRRVLRALGSGDVTVLLGVPGMYRFLAELQDAGPLSPRVRHLLSCTAPLSADVVRQFHARFGRVPCQHYGSSETGAVTLHDQDSVIDRIESVGRAMPGVDLSIVDAGGHVVEPGEAGEVLVRSRAVALGYSPASRPPSDPFGDGSFRTGDIGRIDREGYLRLDGRRDDMINVGGLKVFPAEIVRILESLDGVREAAVTGAKDPHGETFVYAAVTADRPVSEEDLLRQCRGRLAEWKIPRRIDILAELPRTSTGKIRLRFEESTA